jgi:uncharacterized protein (TIGR03083 family)
MKESLKQLHESVGHLAEVVATIDPEKYTSPAYPKEWSIADTMSHIGSGAVILSQRFDDIVAGTEYDQAFHQGVWDEWNAKAPEGQVADALVADGALLDRLQMIDEAGREAFEFSMGPMTFDFNGFVSLRLQEHVLHTWDIEVMGDGSVTLSEGAAAIIIDRTPIYVGFAAKPIGEDLEVRVHTSDPERSFLLSFAGESVTLAVNEHGGNVDLELPGESFVRLIAGRLDAQHTPRSVVGERLDDLRRAFPGY